MSLSDVALIVSIANGSVALLASLGRLKNPGDSTDETPHLLSGSLSSGTEALAVPPAQTERSGGREPGRWVGEPKRRSSSMTRASRRRRRSEPSRNDGGAASQLRRRGRRGSPPDPRMP